MIRLLWILLFGRPCIHVWALVAEKEFPPPVVEYKASGTHYFHVSYLTPGQAMHISKRTYFAVVKCDKCGALKTFERTA